jgi:hypothetical protein
MTQFSVFAPFQILDNILLKTYEYFNYNIK